MSTSKSLVISVSLGAGCYRHLKVSDSLTLEEFSDEILDTFSFMNDHAHAFFMDNRAWSEQNAYYAEFVDYEEEYRHTCDFTLKDVGLVADKKFLYLFDFGEEWRFQCRVLKVLEEETEESVTLRSIGEAPAQYCY